MGTLCPIYAIQEAVLKDTMVHTAATNQLLCTTRLSLLFSRLRLMLLFTYALGSSASVM